MRTVLRYLCIAVIATITAIALIGAILQHGLAFVVFLVVLVSAFVGAAVL